MFQAMPVTASEAGAAAGAAPSRTARAALGPAVKRLCEGLEAGDVIALVSNEQRGEALARAAAALTDALVLWCPAPDGLPGEPASPAVAGRRTAALAALAAREGRRVLLVTDAAAASHRVAGPGAYAAPPLVLAAGAAIDGNGLAERLEALGYFSDDRVDEAGEFAIRGAALDIFPADGDAPIRIHVEDGRIGEIHGYDPISQLRRGDPLDRLALRPAVEPATGEDGVTLFDHLPDAQVALDPDALERRESSLALVRESRARALDAMVAPEAWASALDGRGRIALADGGEVPGRRFVEERRPDRAFLAEVSAARSVGDRIVIAGSARDLRFVTRRLEKQTGEAPRPLSLWRDLAAAPGGSLFSAVVELDRGWREPGLAVFAAADLLGSRSASAGQAATADPLAQEVAEFHVGDAVIHEDHGLAILRGVEPIGHGEIDGEAFRLEYAGGKTRLVPVEDGARLWRYGADAEAVTLDRVDGSSWQARRGDIDATIATTARQLIALAAERESRTAPVLEPAVRDYELFSAGFPFAETPDQLRAIEAVRDDLASGKPMDRLVVGDVGYGKTEVALRAAALAALAGRQVAIVAPTTVLVRQHLDSFRRRFDKLGIAVAGLSRLSSAAEARAVKRDLADGSVRIVVGTKMIAGKTVTFDSLGLVVIDEEQRFGTADKARLRALVGDGHVLTLTATPIPRTLQAALVGLQDLSLITTPPARRVATRTEVATFAAEPVRGALLREKRRGGQSFVVVPRIEDMAPMREQLSKLVPGLSIRQAHGKMAAAEIDEEMIGFAEGDGDILLATNIIEAGLDIPRANTMLVWRADRFGLAQLHQLRGRVGRGRVRGHFLLLTEAEAEIQPATLKRLRTMEALDQLGAGFAISARDLDLRGAGELLGEEQAGHVKLIGTGLYQHLLEQAIRAARGEEAESWVPELNLGLSGGLPESWIPEEDLRINLYVRLARLTAAADAEALAEELEDRFGTLPEEVERLLAIAQIRRLAREARIARVDAGPAAIALTPRPDFRGKPKGLERKDGRLLLRTVSEADESRLDAVSRLLESLLAEG